MLQLRTGDIIANNYRLESHIDTGGFADVWKATFLTAGNIVALKIYPKLDAEGAKNIELEYSNQSELSHSNLLVARYFGFHEGYPFLEMRYCAGGNAASKIEEMDETELVKCMHDIASALDYLHSEDIIHQDIKPNNFLLDSKGKYYLADLGLSLKLRTTIQRFTTTKSIANNVVAGTTPPCYRAPEICDRSSIGSQPIKATDIWAFGSSLYELAIGTVPFGEFGGFTQIKSSEPPDLPKKFSQEFSDIIKKCLAINTWERPKASELVEWTKNYSSPGRKTVYKNPGDYSSYPPENVIQPQAAVPPLNAEQQMVNPGTQKEKEAKPFPVGKLIIGLLIAAALIFGGWFFYKKATAPILVPYNPSIKDTSNLGKIMKDTNKSATETHITPIDSSAKGTNIRSEEKPSAPPAKDNSIETVTYRSPEVERPPSGSSISITKIERTKQNLLVYFRLQKPTDSNGTFSIYGPENPTRCFYIDINGTTYKLLSISPKGQGISYSSGGTKSIRAVFEKIPEETDKINIIEGTDRDEMNQDYWTFIGIHLKK